MAKPTRSSSRLEPPKTGTFSGIEPFRKPNQMPNDDELLHYPLSYRDAVDILKLVRDSEHCTSLSIEFGDMKLSLTREGVVDRTLAESTALRSALAPSKDTAPPSPDIALASSVVKVALPVPDGCVTVLAPMLGTFYRAPTPNSPPFVKAGDQVMIGDTVGLIEVMKLFTPVTAGVAGRVVQILAADAALVEHGQPLIVIEPS
jgi:acetyl-CoA carboxylase biotin carboxyl carrier protein